MLQRIQTIYLIAGGLWTISVGYLGTFLEIDGERIGVVDNPLIAAALGVVVLLFIISIALYRNRNAQVNVNRVNTLYNLLLVGASAYIAYYHIPQIEGRDAHLYWGAMIPILNIVLLYLANRGIMADEELVRSLDRLR